MMPGPLLHVPSAADLCVFALVVMFTIGLLALIRWQIYVLLRIWVPLPVFQLKIFVIVNFACTFLRDDLACCSQALFMAWLYLQNKIPWDKWKKKLDAAVSGLTEVMRAALRREQMEAFS